MDPVWHAIPAVAAVIGVIYTVLANRTAVAKMQGATGQRLDTAEDDIDKLETEQVNQWSKIGEHGERISRIEGQRG